MYVFALLLIYQAKHFLADYPLQNSYMLGKFKPGWDFVGPLATHAGMHALLTFFIAFFWLWKPFQNTPLLVPAGLALFDFVVHFVMDRIKAGPHWLGRFKPLDARCYALEVHVAGDTVHGEFWDHLRPKARAALRGNTYFWWALGFDQMVHHLTHYAIIYILVTQ